MRVAVVGPVSPLIGGIVAHTQGMQTALLRAGHEVRIVGFRRLYPRWLAGDRPGSVVSPVPTSRHNLDPYAPRSWRDTAHSIREWVPDVLVVQYWNPLHAPALRALLAGARPAVRAVVCHNVAPHEWMPGAGCAVRQVLGAADAVVFHSDHAKEAARSLGGTAKRIVVPMPLLVPAEAAVPVAPPELRELAAHRDRLVVHVGHQRGYKGLDVLERAWRRLARSGAVDARLVVAGEPLGAKRALRRISTLPRSNVIARYLSDAEMAWLLGHADVAVLAHKRGSQSGLLPAALALAGTVVASSAAATTTLPAAGRRAPLAIVAAGDASALADAVSGFLRSAVCEPGESLCAARQERWSGYPEQADKSWIPLVQAIERLGQAGESNFTARGAVAKGVVSAAVGPGFTWYHARSPQAAAPCQT